MHFNSVGEKIFDGAIKFVAIMSCCLTAVNAASITPTEKSAVRSWVFTISGGVGRALSGDNQTFYLAPNVLKTYAVQKSNSNLNVLEIFTGFSQKITPELETLLGLSVGYVNNARFQGSIWDDGLAQFDNYSYQYKVKQTNASIKAKLVLDKGGSFLPWIGARIGLGINRAYDYNNSPKIIEAVSNPNFHNHTISSFTYGVSLGAQTKLKKNWQIGIAYEFSDLGKTQLARAEGQTLNSGITQSHLYTNNLIFNVTYQS